MTERYLQFYQRSHERRGCGARRDAGGMERGRAAGAAADVGGRAAAAACCAAPGRCWRWCCCFAVFLPLRGIDLVAERLAGRPVSRLGNRDRAALGGAGAAVDRAALRAARAPMRGGGAFVANHSSWIDIVALQRAAAPFLVSKAEVREWPGVGPIGRAIGTMFIDRRPAEAKRQEAALLARLARGDQMALFPEGTSTDGMRVLPFKSTLFGAFFAPGLKQGVAVQPVTIAYRVRARPAAELLRLVGRDGLRQPRPRRAGPLDRRRRRARPSTRRCRSPDFADRKALAQAADAAVREGLRAPEARG